MKQHQQGLSLTPGTQEWIAQLKDYLKGRGESLSDYGLVIVTGKKNEGGRMYLVLEKMEGNLPVCPERRGW